MKRKLVGISIFCLVLGSLFYMSYTKKNSMPDYMSYLPAEDSVLQNIASENRQIQDFIKTDFTWKDSKGDEYPVYIAHTGSCFVIKTSKSGEDYRAYLGEEVSGQIHKELNNRKSNDVVAQDTISSFLGKPIVINDKIYEQISAIAAQDKMLSYSDSIIQIGNVRWCINLMSDNIVLMTSVQPDEPKMKQMVKYLTGIYGKPYEDEEDGYDIKWSSSDNPSDIFRLVAHLFIFVVFVQKKEELFCFSNSGMKKIAMVIAIMALTYKSYAVTVETTNNLNVYYPEYTKIDLICDQMPKTAQKDVEFCCEAAFTGELLNEFKHSNIADNHICDGVMKKGYRCRANTGGFVWGNGKWKFMRKADYPTTANGWNMGFCQLLIIKDGAVRPIRAKMKNNRNIYRALCEKDGKLCIIESKKVMTYEYFVKCLSAYKVTHALYLDMGRGWNYAWYRDKDGKVKEIFPESKLAPSYKYRTNWITFYK